MPSVPVSSVATEPGEALRMSTRFYQLFRGPTNPVPLPASIVNGLYSTTPGVQQTAITDLRHYVRSLFFLEFGDFFMVTNLVTAGIICLLIVIGLPVVLHRLYHKRLGIFRFERRMQGLYIVPNAINCFLLLEGVYGICTVAFNFSVWKLFHDQMAFWVQLFQAFRSLVWIPLYVGAFLTGWGSFYTAPGALDKPTASRHKTSAKGHLPWPMIVNLSCLGTPVVLVVSLIPPVSLSSVAMVRAFNKYHAWDHEIQMTLDATPAAALIDTAALNAFSSQAYQIFTDWTRSYYYVDIAYVLWGFWALLFLVFYVPAGGVLVYLLWRQVKRQKAVLLSYQRKVEVQQAQEDRQTQVSVLPSEPAHQRGDHEQADKRHSKEAWSAAQPTSRLGAPLDDIFEDRNASDGSEGTGHSGATVSFKGSHKLVGIESALRQEPPALQQGNRAYQGRGQLAGSGDEGEHASSANGQRSGSDPIAPSTPRAPSAFRKLLRAETSSGSNRVGQVSQKSGRSRRKRVSITGGPQSRYNYLRRCLVNLLILYFGIISAACFFGAVTIYLAAVEYEHALRGPKAIVTTITVAGSTAAWVSAVFGVLTVGSIIFRNFDNPQPEASQHSGEGGAGAGGGLRKRFHRNASRSSQTASGDAQQPDGRGMHEHAKTRTLPAVPESVDLEASMMSMVQSRPRMAMNTSMKFAMAEQTSRPGGFVIRADDQLASVMSTGNTPEMEEAPRGGYYDVTASRTSRSKGQVQRPPPAARAWLSRERDATMSVPQDVTESFGLNSLPMARGADWSRSRQGSVERGSSEDPAGFFRSNDTTMAEYPSFDPRILKDAAEASPPATASPPRQDAKGNRAEEPGPWTSTSAVLKRQSRLSATADSETPASKIAREWAQSQYLAAPLPETPLMGGDRSLDTNTLISSNSGSAWVDDLEGSPPSSPSSSPVRPVRDMRRLLNQADSSSKYDHDARF